MTLVDQDQNFGRQNFSKENLFTTTCLIPGGKYILTGDQGFRQMCAKELFVKYSTAQPLPANLMHPKPLRLI